jgi:hypothetical protein
MSEGSYFTVFLPFFHVKKRQKAAKQNPSDMKIKISYTLDDGHVGRNM